MPFDARASDPQLAREAGDGRKVRLALVGLVQDVEVLLVQPDAPEEIARARAADGPHEVGARRAPLAVDAVHAGETPRRPQAVRALGAVAACLAVVASPDVAAIDAERGARRPLATLAGEAPDVGALRGQLRLELP